MDIYNILEHEPWKEDAFSIGDIVNELGKLLNINGLDIPMAKGNIFLWKISKNKKIRMTDYPEDEAGFRTFRFRYY